jgi:hypothetical protein
MKTPRFDEAGRFLLLINLTALICGGTSPRHFHSKLIFL